MNGITNNENQDLRIIKTEFAIRKAFLSLLKKKPYSKISVTEIVEKAQINRNTFYLHYIDKEDLLNKLVLEEFSKYDKTINTAIENYNIIDDFTEEKLISSVKEMLTDINKDIDFYRLLIKDKNLKGYILKIKDYARTRFSSIIDCSFKSKQICMEFCFEGAFGLLFRWVEEGDNLGSLDDVAFAMSKILFEVFQNIKKIKKA